MVKWQGRQGSSNIEDRRGQGGGLGGFGRGLFHLGGDAFHPISAPAVRIEFAFEGERAKSITVRDAQLTLTAERTG